MTSPEDAFIEFAELAGPRLRRTAFLLVGTNTKLRPIQVSWDSGIVFSPDGRTAFALSTHDKQRLGELIPFSTTTNTAGTPIYLGGFPDKVVVLPHSGRAYVEDSNGLVVPVNLISRTVGKPIEAHAFLNVVTVAPDGKAIYVISIVAKGTAPELRLTEISTARNTIVRNVPINGLWPGMFAISPDGSTGFVAVGGGTPSSPTWHLVPIHLANNKLGRPVPFGHDQPLAIAFTK